jgi:signal transduction histidine kinase
MMPVGRWRRWLSEETPPGRIESRYLALGAAVRRQPVVVDLLLAAAVSAFVVPQLVHWARQPAGFASRLLFSVLLVASLIGRRRFPLSVFAFAAAVALLQWSVDVTVAADVALLVHLYTVASRYPVRVGLLAAAVVETGVVLASVRWNLDDSLDLPWIPALLLLSGPVAAALLLGTSVRSRRQALAALADRASHQAAAAVAAERTRIAREMHDIVAHGLSVMVTLSEAAALKQAREPDRAAGAMRQVSSTGRQALEDMRRLLGVLRTDSEGRHPQPGPAQIDALVAQVRETGLEVTVTGSPGSVPAAAGVTVYRIVQEAVTNILKHARAPARVAIDIAYGAGEVVVDVHDDGAQPRGPRSAGGLGLTGMRERAAVHGGTVSAGPDPAGGWRVHARLPMETR